MKPTFSPSLLPLLALSLASLGACAPKSGTGWDTSPVTTAGPALAAPDTVSLRLAEAAEKASGALDSIARIENGQSGAPSESAPYGGPTGVSTGSAATVQAAAPTALSTPTYVAPPQQQPMQPAYSGTVSSSMLPPGAGAGNAAMVAPAGSAAGGSAAGGYTGYGEGEAGGSDGMLVGGMGAVNGVQYAVAPPMGAGSTPLAQAGAPAELTAPVTIKWYGPVESLLNTLAGRAGYAFKTEGAAPPVPLTVNVDVYNKPLVDVIKSASYQVSGKADVELDAGSQTVTLRYAPVSAGSF